MDYFSASNDLEVVTWKNSFGKTWFLIQDIVSGQFRTSDSWESTFAWVRDRAAAAGFPNKQEAELCIVEHENGQDTVHIRATRRPNAEDTVYGTKLPRLPAIPSDFMKLFSFRASHVTTRIV